jgi:hypothetical protein
VHTSVSNIEPCTVRQDIFLDVVTPNPALCLIKNDVDAKMPKIWMKCLRRMCQSRAYMFSLAKSKEGAITGKPQSPWFSYVFPFPSFSPVLELKTASPH